MMTSWFTILGKRSSGTPRRQPATTRAGRCRRVWGPEWLEDRTLLSTFTVTDLSNDPTDLGSLPHAVAQANADPNSTIRFSAGLVGDIPLAGTLELTANATILGPGAVTISMKGGGPTSDFSVLTVDKGVMASLSGLTITRPLAGRQAEAHPPASLRRG